MKKSRNSLPSTYLYIFNFFLIWAVQIFITKTAAYNKFDLIDVQTSGSSAIIFGIVCLFLALYFISAYLKPIKKEVFLLLRTKKYLNIFWMSISLFLLTPIFFHFISQKFIYLLIPTLITNVIFSILLHLKIKNTKISL